MTFFRIRHEQLGGHVHMRVFTVSEPGGQSTGLAGELCLTLEEFADFKRYLSTKAEFVERNSDVSDSIRS